MLLLLRILSVAFFFTATAHAQQFTTVDMGAVKNHDFASLTGGADYASVTGNPWHDPQGIPFHVGDAPRLWLSDDNFVSTPTGGNLSITLDVMVANAQAVYTLMNTAYGVATDSARIDLLGTGGAAQSVIFVGGVDIRDHNNASWPNGISSPDTITVFDSGSGRRLDRQRIDLNSSFAGQALTSIVVTDLVDGSASELLLAGVTVAAVPEPSTLALLAFGMLFVVGGRRLAGHRFYCCDLLVFREEVQRMTPE